MAATTLYLPTRQLAIMKVMRLKTAVLRRKTHQRATPMVATITVTGMIALTIARVTPQATVERIRKTPTLR